MSGAPWDAPDQAAIVARIKATDPDQLRRTAKAFDTAAGQFYTVRGKITGLGGDLVNDWNGDGWKSFYDYSGKLTSDLSTVESTLHDMAGQLRAHAKVTEDARADVVAAEKVLDPPAKPSDKPSLGTRTPNPSPSGEEPGNAWPAASNKLSNAVHAFHASEQRVRKNLWEQGSLAPGKIPIPELPPPPKLPWWQQLLFGSPQGPQYWIYKDGQPYGYDEDGNLVPAYMAEPMAMEIKEDGIPVGPLLRWLGRGAELGEAATGEEAASQIAKSVMEDYAFRPSHIDPKIREFYNLPADKPVPEWARDEYAKLIGKAAASSQKVFRWDTGGQKCYSVLYRDPDTKQWIAAIFHADGEYAGELSSAYRPSAEKIDEMLRKAALG